MSNAEQILQTCYEYGVDPVIRREALETLAKTEAILSGDWIEED